MRVASDNQSVIDGSEAVFLAIRPQIAEEVIRPLVFRRGQRVISIIAATERQTLLERIGTDVHLTQAVPLPFVEDRESVTAIFPPDEFTAARFDSLGTAVQRETVRNTTYLPQRAPRRASSTNRCGWIDRNGGTTALLDGLDRVLARIRG